MIPETEIRQFARMSGKRGMSMETSLQTFSLDRAPQ
jgi:hypothetical protein